MAKILIVDDTFEDLQSMKSLLEKNGHTVITATNGAQGFEKLAEDLPVDLLLASIKMPILSGYDLTKLVREKYGHSLKIVYASIVPQNEADLKDVDGFIQKPYSPEKFMETINTVLATPAAPDAPAKKIKNLS
ncbi:MAG: response regulator [archaeon]